MSAKDQAALSGREVLLCVTGGVACYKSAELTSRLVQAGAGVTVAMSESATRFVGPLTFQALTRRQVYTSMWQSGESFDSRHIALTELAELMIVAPATANTIAKMAGGIADELIPALALAATGECDILIAPAMNVRMWQAPATRANMQRLSEWGVHVVGPGEGYLACGAIGPGRLAEPEEIFAAAVELLAKKAGQ